MQRLIFSLVLVLAASCHRPSPVSVGGVAVPVELQAAAAEHRFDYTGNLAKALRRDAQALKLLLLFSQKTEGAAAVQHGAALLSLLGKTGDELFAATLAQLLPEAKRPAWAALDQGAEAGKLVLKKNAPLTWTALLPNGEAGEHRGLYILGEKTSTYLDCAEPGKRHVAADLTGDIERNYRRLLPKPYPGQPIYAEVKGFTTDFFGAAALPDNYAAFFVVTEIIELEAKNHRNTCIPYDLWAMGAEPFWEAQVSAGEGVVEFRSADGEGTKVFAYAPPSRQDSAQVYAAFNQDTGDNIRIVVRRQPCSDGMSEISYPQKVELTVNGRSLSGCGIPFGL